MPELLTGLGIFKALYDSAKALKDINDAAIRNAAVIELQEKILIAREAQTSLTERISELEKQVADFETWERDKQEYTITSLPSGTIVYQFVSDTPTSKPPHYICAKCYEKRKRSILQPVRKSAASFALQIPDQLRCPECKTDFLA
jgi:spore cortex formation protein SpoVR/YcgB (stage V sporulation)